MKRPMFEIFVHEKIFDAAKNVTELLLKKSYADEKYGLSNVYVKINRCRKCS
ncbi:Uncharacterised protein [uncultured archaeon]|nr:Uncharacterised protein [uncultured archaeon]